jgi:hypothetical protein
MADEQYKDDPEIDENTYLDSRPKKWKRTEDT